MGPKLAKTELFAQWRAGSMVVADQGLSTGRRIWVHSGTGTDQGGSGANPDDPLATLDAANNLCTANKGDIIYLMPGHAETLAVAGELADMDVDGIIIQGLGVGADRPTFTLGHADAQITVDGASITIRNIRVEASVADVVQALEVGAGADGLTIEGCEFEDGGTNITELTDAIIIAAACDDVTIRNCRFLAATGGTIASAITFEGASDNSQIVGCYFNGDYATAAIVGSGAAQTRLLIATNWMKVLDGEPGIELHANSLGIISRNHIETTGMADADLAIVADDCSWFLNYAVISDGGGAELIGAAEAGSVEGKVDSVGVQVSTVDSKVVSAHVITDSKVVSAHVVSDAAISVADSKVVSAHVITDSKVVSAHVVSDAAISVADSKVVSAHVVTDAAVSVADSKVVSAHVITDSKVVSAHVVTDAALTTLDNWDVRTVKKSALALDAGGAVDVFAVNNGPVELLGLIMHTTEVVSGNPCNTKWQSDPTVGTGPTDLCTNVDIDAMTLGSSLYIDGPGGSAAVIAVMGTLQPEMCDIPQVVLPGGIDLVQANSNPTSGIADVFLVYRPLAANATVTAP